MRLVVDIALLKDVHGIALASKKLNFLSDFSSDSLAKSNNYSQVTITTKMDGFYMFLEVYLWIQQG